LQFGLRAPTMPAELRNPALGLETESQDELRKRTSSTCDNLNNGDKEYVTLNTMGSIYGSIPNSNKAKDLAVVRLQSMREISCSIRQVGLGGRSSIFHLFRRFIGDYKQAGEMIKFQKNLKNIKKHLQIDNKIKKYKTFILFMTNLGLQSFEPALKQWSKVSYLYHHTKVRIQNLQRKRLTERGNLLLTCKPMFDGHNLR
jgi:hypothetical protein